MTIHQTLQAGAAAVDITPQTTQFLFGYPHVVRFSTGVHDPLLSSALYLAGDGGQALLIANDIIFIPKPSAFQVRARLSRELSIPEDCILLSATHTHSGPSTVDYLSNAADPAVPAADPEYLQFMEDRIVEAGLAARRAAEPAELGLALADGGCVGANRRDPAGPADPQIPVLLARSLQDRRSLACMLICSMHPTVLHEDSTLVSADFPGLTRQYLQAHLLGPDCPVLHHTGPAGNQSPRHVVRANTFAEAERLGFELGRSIVASLESIEFQSAIPVQGRRAFIELERREFPEPEAARAGLGRALARLQEMRAAGAPAAEIRTAECDWFGAEETLVLAQAARDGRLEQVRQACLPAEIQALQIGPWWFVGWPGEIFVEYALAFKQRRAQAYVISLANGELQGYIATPEAAAEGGYEASNALFHHDNGARFIETALRLIDEMCAPAIASPTITQ